MPIDFNASNPEKKKWRNIEINIGVLIGPTFSLKEDF